MNLEKKTSDLKTLAPNPELVLLDEKNPDILAVQNEIHEVIEGVSLPEYIKKTNNGLCVDLALLPPFNESQFPEKSFTAFIDAVFSQNYFLEGVDYKILCDLLYEPQIIQDELKKREKSEASTLLHFANSQKQFDINRRALYKDDNLTFPEHGEGASAFYLFEKVGLPDPKNMWKIISTQLNIDEFIAFLWGKGIRYGVEVKTVNTVIHSSELGVVMVAKQLGATKGEGAKYQKLTENMDQHIFPKILANGMVRMVEQQNHFPQVYYGDPLLKKIPAKPGKHGRNIRGHYIPAPAVSDFNLEDLKGTGTFIEHHSEGDRIVACRDGFVTYDENGVFIADHIKNDCGTNKKTTGNLLLSGDYHETKNVEGVELSGFSFQIDGEVCNSVIISRGAVQESETGRIIIGRSVTNSWLINKYGNIVIKGDRVESLSRCEARQGDIEAKNGQNSVFIGKKVHLKTAQNCVIIADEVQVDEFASNCIVIASSSVNIRLIQRRTKGFGMDSKTKIIHAMPNFPSDEKIQEETQSLLNNLSKVIARLSTIPEMKKYIDIRGKIQGKTLTPDQKKAFETIKSHARSHCSVMDFDRAMSIIEEIEEHLEALKKIPQARKEALKNWSCIVQEKAIQEEIARLPVGKTLMDLSSEGLEKWITGFAREALPQLKQQLSVVKR